MKKSVVKLKTISEKYQSEHPWSPTMDKSCGSGFVIQNRIIVTCAHVAHGAMSVEGSLPDDPEVYSFREIYANPQWDICLLTTDCEDFWKKAEPLELGDIPAQDEQIKALGFPLNCDNMKSTSGTVASLQYDIPSSYSREYFLSMHVDLEINPGNSGGPLVNMHQQVVGMASQSQRHESMHKTQSFAVPVNLIKRTLENYLLGFPSPQVIPTINLKFQDLINKLLRQQLGLNDNITGIMVTELPENAPYAGQIQSEDIIVEIDGHKISNDGKYSTEFAGLISCKLIFDLKKIGDIVEVVLLRNGQQISEKITLDAHDKVNISQTRLMHQEPTFYNYNGLVFMPLSYYRGQNIKSLVEFSYLDKECNEEMLEAIKLQCLLPCEWSTSIELVNMPVVIVDAINDIKIRHIWDLIDAFAIDKNVHKLTTKAKEVYFVPRMQDADKQALVKKYNLQRMHSANLNPERRSEYFSERFPAKLASKHVDKACIEQNISDSTAIIPKKIVQAKPAPQYMWHNYTKLAFGIAAIGGLIAASKLKPQM